MAASERTHKRGCLFWVSRALIAVVILVVGLLAFGLGIQALAESNEQRTFPPAGVLIDVGGYKLHLYCQGEGSPTVILDSLQPGTVSDWVWVQPEVAKVTRVC